MKKGLPVLLIILGIVLFAGCSISSSYNGLVAQDEEVAKAWNNVQSEYQRRNDLIPNLVNTVKGAADFEQKTLTDLMAARAKATSINLNADDLTPEKIAEFQAAQSQVSAGLGRLLAVVENYPDLKANQNFRDLQVQLEGTENRIKTARNDYNAAVQVYNTKVRSFPMNLVAGMFGFKAKQGFQADPGAERAPTVTF